MIPRPADQGQAPECSGIRLIEPQWAAPASVHALSTTRSGGHSQGPYTGFNLGAGCGDNPRHVAKNRWLLRTVAGLPSEPVWLRQIHGTRVVDAPSATTAPRADASISTEAGVICAILSADCLPVLLCDERGLQVAAAYAGWRGLAAGVLEATVTAMGTHPARLLAWLGPAIGPAAYEVGDEVRAPFIREVPGAQKAFQVSPNGRWLADLYALARLRLKRIGVTRITGGEYCTHSDPQDFFSYRRDAVCGRMASCIWLQN